MLHSGAAVLGSTGCCRGPGSWSQPGEVAILQEAEWDCALGYSLCRALERQVPGVCPGLSPHPHPLGDLVSCVFLMQWCAQDLPCSMPSNKPLLGTSRGMW